MLNQIIFIFLFLPSFLFASMTNMDYDEKNNIIQAYYENNTRFFKESQIDFSVEINYDILDKAYKKSIEEHHNKVADYFNDMKLVLIQAKEKNADKLYLNDKQGKLFYLGNTLDKKHRHEGKNRPYIIGTLAPKNILIYKGLDEGVLSDADAVFFVLHYQINPLIDRFLHENIIKQYHVDIFNDVILTLFDVSFNNFEVITIFGNLDDDKSSFNLILKKK